jgi:predicted peptidase
MRSALCLLAVLCLVAACSDEEAPLDAAGGGGAAPAAGGGGADGGTGGLGGIGGMGGIGATGGTGGEGAGGGLPGGPSSQRLTLRPLGSVAGAPLGYAEYLPPGYGDGVPRPLLVFHHGIGESGDGSEAELDRLFNTGLPPLIENDEWPEERPFIVLMTQHIGAPFTGCHTVAEVETFLDFAVDHYDVDAARVYITGLSCGAIGSWNYLGAHTDEVVAAAVLIAGNGNPAFAQAGCNLGRVPIWAFHGAEDIVVAPSGSIDAIESINECTTPPPVEALLTLYAGVGHESWDRTYDLSAGNDIYTWLLGYSHP